MMLSAQTRASAMSPLGTVTLDVSGTVATVINVDPADVSELPEEMAVDGVMLFSVRLVSPATRKSPVVLRATAHQDGDPETGQFLDSIAFESEAGVLQVAVRDDEWLAANGIIADPVGYDRQGFTQIINEAPTDTVLHVSVAWRAAPVVGMNDASTWFAADLALPG